MSQYIRIESYVLKCPVCQGMDHWDEGLAPGPGRSNEERKFSRDLSSDCVFACVFACSAHSRGVQR
jgi:hypothetical protein